MATTLVSIIPWARRFLGNLSLFHKGSKEPALTNANIILGTMLSPPFTWEWNRNIVSFYCQNVLTDYIKPVSDFGFIESGSLTVPNSAPIDAQNIYAMQTRRNLDKTAQLGRPGFVSVFMDDGQGNITFRVGSAAPDQPYFVIVTYQKSFVPLTSTSQVLPIPDKLVHIFKYGFASLALLYNQDTRFREMNQKFISTLLGTQQGLSAQEKNVFLVSWYTTLSDQVSIGPTVQQGFQERGSL
jgi:hypothetical protein